MPNFHSITICFSNKKLNILMVEKNFKEKSRSQFVWCFNENSRICLKEINGRCLHFCGPWVIIFFITTSITILISTAFFFFSNFWCSWSLILWWLSSKSLISWWLSSTFFIRHIDASPYASSCPASSSPLRYWASSKSVLLQFVFISCV